MLAVGAVRQGRALAWTQQFSLPAGGSGQLDLKSEEDAASVKYTTAVKAAAAFEVDAIEFVVDLPRALFLNGRVTPQGAAPVTLAIAKKKGSNAVWVARDIISKVEELRKSVVPADMELVVMRNMGVTANHKVNELVKHLAIPVATIIVLLALALGPKESFIVALAVLMPIVAVLPPARLRFMESVVGIMAPIGILRMSTPTSFRPRFSPPAARLSACRASLTRSSSHS